MKQSMKKIAAACLRLWIDYETPSKYSPLHNSARVWLVLTLFTIRLPIIIIILVHIHTQRQAITSSSFPLMSHECYCTYYKHCCYERWWWWLIKKQEKTFKLTCEEKDCRLSRWKSKANEPIEKHKLSIKFYSTELTYPQDCIVCPRTQFC